LPFALVVLTFWYGPEWLVRAVRRAPRARNPIGDAAWFGFTLARCARPPSRRRE
jgi:hypothetical protein